MTSWADMTPVQRRAAARAACKKLEIELNANAEAIGAAFDEFAREVRNEQRRIREESYRADRGVSS